MTGAIDGDLTLNIRSTMVEELLPRLIGTRVFPTVNIGPAGQYHGYKSIDEMKDAQLIGPGQKYPVGDQVQTWAMAVMQKPGIALQLTDEDRKADPGVLDRLTRAASRSVARRIDDCIFNGGGGAGPVFDGALDGANNTHAAVDTWDKAAGTAFPHTDVNGALGELEDDEHYGPYVLLLHPENYGELRKLDIQAGGSGIPWIDEVKALIGDNIWATKAIPEGTGLLMEPGLDNFVILEAEPLTVKDPLVMPNDTAQWNVYARIVPLYYRDTSGCTITGI